MFKQSTLNLSQAAAQLPVLETLRMEGYSEHNNSDIQKLYLTGLQLLRRLVLRSIRVMQLFKSPSCQVHLSMEGLHEVTMPN